MIFEKGNRLAIILLIKISRIKINERETYIIWLKVYKMQIIHSKIYKIINNRVADNKIITNYNNNNYNNNKIAKK